MCCWAFNNNANTQSNVITLESFKFSLGGTREEEDEMCVVGRLIITTRTHNHHMGGEKSGAFRVEIFPL